MEIDEKKMKNDCDIMHWDIQTTSDKIENETKNQDQNFWKLILKRNGFQARWLCLRWQTTFFHYCFYELENYP